MPNLHSLKISRSRFLRGVPIDLLRSFIEPFADYLDARGLRLDKFTEDNDVGYELISEILASPDHDTPDDLVEALYIISEVSGTPHADKLIEDASELGLESEDAEPPEVTALRVWVRDAARLKQRYAETFLIKARSFEYFSAEADDVRPFQMPSATVLQALERSLDVWFQKHKRGRGCHVRVYPRGHEVWFMVCHGDLFQRVGTWQDGQTGSLGYRPDKYDIVVYDQLTAELRVNAGQKNLRDVYRKQFGFHLFGKENHFPGTNKYSLEPLREDGDKALMCDDIPGIRWIKLSKLTYECPHGERLKRTLDGDDLLAAIKQRDITLDSDHRLLSATFMVRFANNPKARSVTIRPSNVALYTRDEDSILIEQWLTARKFIIETKVEGYEQVECVLEIT